MSLHDPEERPVELPEAAEQEDVSRADAARRLELDPEEQRNATDDPPEDARPPEDD
jgi:hypothetical protein